MKMNIMVAGVRYACHNDETATAETLAHLRQTLPMVVLVMENSDDYGVVVTAIESHDGTLSERGKVSRLDIDGVLEAMRRSGFESLTARVTHVYDDGAYFVVETDVPDDLAATAPSTRWDTWQWTGAPLMKMTSSDSDVETCAKVLRMALSCPGALDDDTVMLYLKRMTESVRFDVTREAHRALKTVRDLLPDYPSDVVSNYHPLLVKNINDMGSAKRQEEMDTYWNDTLLQSIEARQMTEQWHRMAAATMDARAAYLAAAEMQARVEDCLRRLPEGLYNDIDSYGTLMHRLLYMDIPRKKLQMLLSALVLRHHLMQMKADPVAALPEHRRRTVERLDELIGRGDWLKPWTAAKVRRLMRRALGVAQADNVPDSAPLWALLEQGKGDRLRVGWQNLAGFFMSRGMIDAPNGAPDLNYLFFGDRDGYTNIYKGANPETQKRYALQAVIPILEACMAKTSKSVEFV